MDLPMLLKNNYKHTDYLNRRLPLEWQHILEHIIDLFDYQNNNFQYKQEHNIFLLCHHITIVISYLNLDMLQHTF